MNPTTEKKENQARHFVEASGDNFNQVLEYLHGCMSSTYIASEKEELRKMINDLMKYRYTPELVEEICYFIED